MRKTLAAGLLVASCGGSAVPLVDSGLQDSSTIVDASMMDVADAHATDVSVVDVSDAQAAGYGPYGAAGSHTVTTMTLSVPAPNGTFSVTVYVPSGGGLFPIVIFSSGFFQPAIAYDAYAQRLASWGIVAALRDDPGLNESATNEAGDIVYEVTTWLPSQNSSGSLSGKLDVGKIGLSGHSRGGQVSLLAAEGGAKGHMLGVFGVDPVDGSPAALTSINTIAVPLAFVGETTDSGGTMACAPAAQNFQAFYTAAASPAVAMTVAGADHTMFEDPAHCAFCGFCQAGTANGDAVRSLSVRYLMAFFARELLGDSSVGATFAGAGASLDVTSGAIQLQSK